MNSETGRYRCRIATTTTTKHTALRHSPARRSSLWMVEIQLGLSDMTQSIAAKAKVNAYNTSPGPLRTRNRCPVSFVGGSSCSADHLLSSHDSTIQIAK